MRCSGGGAGSVPGKAEDPPAGGHEKCTCVLIAQAVSCSVESILKAVSVI